MPPRAGFPLAATGALVFPNADGFQATAHYKLSSAPSGAVAALNTHVGSAGLPSPYGSNGVVAAFTITVDEPVQMSQPPTWQITVPAPAAAEGLSLEICPGNSCTMWEAAYQNGQTLSVTGVDSGLGTISLSPGLVYAFELVLPPTPPLSK